MTTRLQSEPGRPADRLPSTATLAAAIVALVAVVYAQARTFGFVNLDDQQYVLTNRAVLRGLGWDGLRWAFGSFYAANWHPLTWLSHMADVSLFGLDAGGHHAVNVALHALNAVLLLALLVRATGARRRSAVVAALFAIHPLNVESVAWVSERKTILSAAFFFLMLHAWLSWVRRPSPGRYAAAAVLLLLGLLSKPMLVTVPCLLLLLDAWPLGRLGDGAGATSRVPARRLVVEKLPLFAIVAASSVVTWLAQDAGETTTGLEAIPIAGRFANALVAYVLYLWRTVWPAGLAEFYPHPVILDGGIPTWKVAGAAALLASVTVFAIRQRAQRPWVLVGWLWYLGMMVPVIGIVQVGLQGLADRYVYLPLVGILIAAVWGGAEALDRLRAGLVTRTAAAAVPVLLLIPAAYRQAETWRDSVTLHRHAVASVDRNYVAWSGLGDALVDEGKPEDAIAAYREAIRIRPDHAPAWNGLGAALGARGAPAEAIAPLERAVRLNPRYADAWYNLGTAHGNLGAHARAAECFRVAVRLRPDDARAWYNLGIATALLGDLRGATESLRALSPLDPARARALAAFLDARAR